MWRPKSGLHKATVQGRADQFCLLLAYNTHENYVYSYILYIYIIYIYRERVVYINHIYWSFVHQLRNLVYGGGEIVEPTLG